MARRGEIGLGDEAKDTITGLSGCVVAITDWLNGCQRVTIQPRELKDGKPIDSFTFDTEQIEVIKKAKLGPEKEKTGGPSIAPTRQADVR